MMPRSVPKPIRIITAALLSILFPSLPGTMVKANDDLHQKHTPLYTEIRGIYQLGPTLHDSILLLQLREDGQAFWWHEQGQKIMEGQIGTWQLQDSTLSLLHGQNVFPELPEDSCATSMFGPNKSRQAWQILTVDSSGITAKTNGKKPFFLKKEHRLPDGLEQKWIRLLSDNAFQKRLTRRFKKMQRRNEVKHLIEQRRFVMAADFANDNNRGRYRVTRELNFILIDSSEGCLQSGSTWRRGRNQVGGITVDGPVRNFTVKEITEKSVTTYFISLSMMTSYWGLVIIRMSVDENGNANTFVTGGTIPGYFSFTGELLPISNAFVFKGYSK